MEKFCTDHEGYAALYSETQLTREEFDRMFSSILGLYEKVRKDLNCEKAFPHVYEKVSKLGRKSGFWKHLDQMAKSRPTGVVWSL